ncbi:MAG TPA: hypothetical protein ENN28_02860 [Candidatus Uhrbacteria bacterium]|nr:hypothetical protein [Candidatus Uhrbacteria bacterium]
MKKRWHVLFLVLALFGIMIFIITQIVQRGSNVSEPKSLPRNNIYDPAEPMSHEQKVSACLKFLAYSYKLTCNPISYTYEKCQEGMRNDVRECLRITGLDTSEEAVNYFRFPFGRYFCDWVEEQSRNPEEDSQGRQAFNDEYNRSCPFLPNVVFEDQLFCQFIKVYIGLSPIY